MPCAIQSAIIIASINTLIINTGIVIFVGKAARFTTRQATIPDIANIQNTKLFPENIIANNVTIVMKQACPANAIASHNSLFFSSLIVQLTNRLHKET